MHALDRSTGLRDHHPMLVLCVVLLLSIAHAGATRGSELVPSFGITRAVGGVGGTHTFSGLAFRTSVAPLLQGEVAVAYRSDERLDERSKVRAWPVIASLYLTPVPMLYGGAGVGSYPAGFAFPNGVLGQSETSRSFGVHVGGGVKVPYGPTGLDLGVRYVMMRDSGGSLEPQRFKPDFWTTTLGLALRF